MNEVYDVVVCGTGFTECIISGLLSVEGKKVLHLDRNAYYGAESASLNLTHLWARFRPNETPPAELGANRDWNIDIIPKFVMSHGSLVKMLLKTGVSKYLEWQVVDGTYVYQYQKAGFIAGEKHIHKVPATEREILTSQLMSLFEKNRSRSFFNFATRWNGEDPETHKPFDYHKTLMSDVYAHFNLHSTTIDFVGHAVALHTSDKYLSEPCGPTFDKIKMYVLSLARFGNSPFIYPVYGLGGLPEGFSRLSARYGGTYMLNAKIKGFKYDSQGKVCGVEDEDGQVAQCKMVVCDPTYVQTTNKVKKINQVIRALCLLTSPIKEAAHKNSCQVIIPQNQTGRQHDIYITLVSHTHGIAKQGYYVAIVSTTVETDNPTAEIQVGLDLLGDIKEKFIYISDVYHNSQSGKDDQVFVSKSYDATSHFESATEDVMDLYKRITGKDLDLTLTLEQQEDAE
eukprot:GHVP01024290.1.p1 GENE.GHVP01024290.1~~GHVP01024290.1.p1  ORF type:complete len:455 (+),score=61.46 GHVP01024290.1:1292-2656(+)